ncbi:MAG TPA: hypothetical protein PK402_12220 [Tepidisphaeraceae bacterium]|nr:hypothetical protein [Tepidisphaeraceae bacterium]
MTSDKFKAACLAATIATAWIAPAADAGVVELPTYYARSTVPLTYIMENVRVIGMGSGSGAGYEYADLGQMQGGVQDRSFILDGGHSPNRFVTVGMGSGFELFVSMPDSSSAVGIEFTDLFPGFDENTLMQDLASGGTSSTFDAFVQRLDELQFFSPPEVECDTVHFSQGVLLGTFLISSSPIPEPGMLSIVVLSGMTLLYRRRK